MSLRSRGYCSGRFDVLPDVVCRTSSLIVVDVSDNSLTTVPSALSRLPRLVELNLQRNALDSFPDDAGPPNLERLNVSANRLRRLSVLAMRRLRRLDADGNWLTEMPRGVYQLEALEALSVAGNRIAHLSSSVVQLTRLRLLDVSDNALRSLPKALDRMPSLVTLNVEGNDVKLPRGGNDVRPPRDERRHAGQDQTSRRNDTAVNGPIPTFVLSADPATRAVYTSPILATPNGDLLYRPPLPPSPAKSGRRVRGLFRRKEAAVRDNASTDRAAMPVTWTTPSLGRHRNNNNHNNDDIHDVNSSSLSHRRSSSVAPELRRRDAGDTRVPLSADEATRRGRTRVNHQGDSLSRRQMPPTDLRSRSVTDLRGTGTLLDNAADGVDDGLPAAGAGTIRSSRLANVGRLAAAGIDLQRQSPASTVRGRVRLTQRDQGSGRDGGQDATRSDESLFAWDDQDDDVDRDDDRCSDTVTVNEAVGDELSLGEDDFEFLPTNIEDSKLKRIADDLETLLNRQLLQPLIGDADTARERYTDVRNV